MSGYCNGCGWTICICNETKTKKSRHTKNLTSEQRLRKIREIILSIENRCLAMDGPVTKTSEEITEKELREIYELASII